MTPQEVELAARRRYNAESTSFWSPDELFKVIYEAEQILATEAEVIEGRDISISTVIGTRAYDYPSLYIALKRIEWNGNKLQNIDFRDDDTLTFNNSVTVAQGDPYFYTIWNDQIYLRPIPSSVQTLTIYGFKEATLLTTASVVLSVPARCHTALIDYVIAQMAAKDGNYQLYDRFMSKWDTQLLRLKQWSAKRKRADAFAVVKDEESLSNTLLGAV